MNIIIIKNLFNFLMARIFLFIKTFKFIITLDVFKSFLSNNYKYWFRDMELIYWFEFYLITLYNFIKLIFIDLILVFYSFKTFNFLLEILDEFKKDLNYFFIFVFDFIKSFFLINMIIRRFSQIFVFLLFPFFHFFYFCLICYKYFIKYFVFFCDLIFYWFFIDLKKLYKIILRIISNNFYNYFGEAFDPYIKKRYINVSLFIDNKIFEKYIDYWLKIYILLKKYFLLIFFDSFFIYIPKFYTIFISFFKMATFLRYILIIFHRIDRFLYNILVFLDEDLLKHLKAFKYWTIQYLIIQYNILVLYWIELEYIYKTFYVSELGWSVVNFTIIVYGERLKKYYIFFLKEKIYNIFLLFLFVIKFIYIFIKNKFFLFFFFLSLKIYSINIFLISYIIILKDILMKLLKKIKFIIINLKLLIRSFKFIIYLINKVFIIFIKTLLIALKKVIMLPMRVYSYIKDILWDIIK